MDPANPYAAPAADLGPDALSPEADPDAVALRQSHRGSERLVRFLAVTCHATGFVLSFLIAFTTALLQLHLAINRPHDRHRMSTIDDHVISVLFAAGGFLATVLGYGFGGLRPWAPRLAIVGPALAGVALEAILAYQKFTPETLLGTALGWLALFGPPIGFLLSRRGRFVFTATYRAAVARTSTVRDRPSTFTLILIAAGGSALAIFLVLTLLALR